MPSVVGMPDYQMPEQVYFLQRTVIQQSTKKKRYNPMNFMSNYTLLNNCTSSYEDIVAQIFGQRLKFESMCALFIETEGVYEQ
jgi:hypothetical protein